MAKDCGAVQVNVDLFVRVCVCVHVCVCVAVCLCAHMKSALTDYRGSHLICSTVHSLLLLIPVHFPFCNLSIYCRVVVVEVVVRSESMIVI